MGENAFCRLPAGDRPRRTEDFRALFAGTLIDRQRAPGSVQWTLRGGPDIEAESRRLAALEERCCDGLVFHVYREADRVMWRITGPPASDPALDALYELPVLVATDEGADELWTRLDAGSCGPAKRA